MKKVFVGIDWANKKHDVCLMTKEGEKTKEFSITHDAAGFAKFDAQLKSYDKEQIFICIETNHGLLFQHLVEFGYHVFPVNPGALVDYRKTRSLSSNKNDRLDALLLSDYIREHVHRLREYKMNSDISQILKLLTEDRQRFLKQKVRLENQLVDTLKLFYPVALELFCDVTNQISLDFLLKYPTPEKAKRLSLKGMRNFLKKHHYPKANRAQELINLLKKEQPRAPKVYVQAKERFIKAVVPQIKALINEIKDYDDEIKKYYDRHPDKKIFDNLPGAADVIGPRLLSCFGDNREQFPSFSNIQCLAGTVPVTKKSGQYCHVSFRFSCNKIFRDVMSQLAFCSLTQSLWAKTYYQKQRQRGHAHWKAIRALSNKWLKIIHRLWMTNGIYDENYHLAQIARKALEASVVT